MFKSKYQKEYDDYQKSVKSYFDLFDKIKAMAKEYHGFDEANYMNWLRQPQEVLAGYSPLSILKRNEIMFIYERYYKLTKSNKKVVNHKS